MSNMNEIKTITDKIYKNYGSESGILFGIKERSVVEAIVQFTLSYSTTTSVTTDWEKDFHYYLSHTVTHDEEKIKVIIDQVEKILKETKC